MDTYLLGPRYGLICIFVLFYFPLFLGPISNFGFFSWTPWTPVIFGNSGALGGVRTPGPPRISSPATCYVLQDMPRLEASSIP